MTNTKWTSLQRPNLTSASCWEKPNSSRTSHVILWTSQSVITRISLLSLRYALQTFSPVLCQWLCMLVLSEWQAVFGFGLYSWYSSRDAAGTFGWNLPQGTPSTTHGNLPWGKTEAPRTILKTFPKIMINYPCSTVDPLTTLYLTLVEGKWSPASKSAMIGPFRLVKHKIAPRCIASHSASSSDLVQRSQFEILAEKFHKPGGCDKYPLHHHSCIYAQERTTSLKAMLSHQTLKNC